MGRTEIAGFPLKSYKTLQAMARETATFQRKINGMGVVQSELFSARQKNEESRYSSAFCYLTSCHGSSQ
jgi:hypothetical protein